MGGRGSSNNQILNATFNDRKVRRLRNRRLHGLAIELAICLRARPMHGRTLRAIEQPELDSRLIRDPAHQAIQRIDFADQMPLTEPTNRRIARHLADRRGLVGDQRRSSTHARARSRSLTARMPAADNNDIE